MTDEIVQPPVTPPAPEPAKPSKDVQDAAHKNAEYFARNPEVLDATLGLLEKAGVVHANQRIDQLQRELTIRDALADNSLTRADAAFLTGNTPEQINASAAAFKARLDSAAVRPPEAPPIKKVEAVTPPVVPPLPDHRGNRTSLQQAEADLLEAGQGFCANFDLTTLGRS